MKTLTLTEVARRLGICVCTARKIHLPGGVRIGRRIRYREEEVLNFIERGGCHSESRPAA